MHYNALDLAATIKMCLKVQPKQIGHRKTDTVLSYGQLPVSVVPPGLFVGNTHSQTPVTQSPISPEELQVQKLAHVVFL